MMMMWEMRDTILMKELSTTITTHNLRNFYAQTHLNHYPSDFTDFTHGDAVEASMVPEDMLEKVSLNLDEKIPERWTKSHGLFVNEGDINSEEYHEKVLLIALGKWRKLDLDAEDAERFDRRRRNNWSGVDSVYDAYLLCGEDPRDQFDYDLFLERYPGWPKAWEHRYGSKS